VEGLHHLDAGLPGCVFHCDFGKEFLRHSFKGIWWPGGEPINGRAVDDRWEVSDPVPEGVTNGREAEDNMQRVFTSFQKVCEELSWCAI